VVTGGAAYQRALARLYELSERQDELSTSMHIAVMEAFNTIAELRQPLVPDSSHLVALPMQELWAATIASIDEAARTQINLPEYLRLVAARRFLSDAVRQP
jgi:hypothetical protein